LQDRAEDQPGLLRCDLLPGAFVQQVDNQFRVRMNYRRGGGHLLFTGIQDRIGRGYPVLYCLLRGRAVADKPASPLGGGQVAADGRTRPAGSLRQPGQRRIVFRPNLVCLVVDPAANQHEQMPGNRVQIAFADGAF
jgi:hypothetical protein